MASRIHLVEDEGLSARFPAERIAVASLTLVDGTVLTSAPTPARGDPEGPLTDEAIRMKFRTLTDHLPAERQTLIERAIMALDQDRDAASTLANAVLGPLSL